MDQVDLQNYRLPRFFRSQIASALVVWFLYAAVAWVGFLTTSIPGHIAPIFPAAGIALAAVLILGGPALWGVWLGSLTGNLLAGLSAPPSNQALFMYLATNALVATGATAGSLFGAFLVRRFSRGTSLMGSARNIVVLIGLGAIVGCMISPTVGVLVLGLTQSIPGSVLGTAWLTWWLGDSFGAVMIAPLILGWLQEHPFEKPPRRLLESTLVGAMLGLLSYLVFFCKFRFEFGFIPLIMWIVLRFDIRWASTATAIIGILATLGTIHGGSTFSSATINESLLFLHSFLGVAILSTLLFSGIVIERERANERLRDSEENFRSIVDNAPDAVFVQSDGYYVYFNQLFQQLVGCAHAADLLGKQFWNFLAPESHEAVNERIRLQRENSKPVPPMELELMRVDGSRVPVESTAMAIHFNRHLSHLVFIRDISERKRLQTQLLQSQKMEAIGTLAGGIAHDFNNILMAISGFATLANQMSMNPEQKECLDNVLDASSRASELVKQILTFSRMSQGEVKRINPTHIIREALKLLRASIPSTIEIRAKLTADATILADPGEIHRIMLNLCTNAALAMKDKGGVLEVNLLEKKIAEACVSEQDAKPGRYVCLTIEDTGCGMNDEVKTRIFEPFFTTRAEGEGTGMGLAVVHGIVKNRGGVIKVASTPGRGTIFEILLPVVGETESIPLQAEEHPLPGDERILFVDDEPMLAEFVEKSLSNAGYRVTSFASSQEALARFQARPDDFDLVITDVTMPGMTGDILVEKIREIRPRMPFVVCSGFSDRLDAEEAKAMCHIEFASKPVTAVQLSKLIRKLLGERGEG